LATKPKLARRMIARALDAGTPAGWVTGDEVYGADPGLHADLEGRQIGYVLAVAATHQVTTSAGTAKAARSPPACPDGRGSSIRPARAPKGPATTIGAGSAPILGGPVTTGC
jgi:SRSO17 transposase